MLNRYQGNSGRVVRVEESAALPSVPRHEPKLPFVPPEAKHGRPGAMPGGGLSGALGGIGEKLSRLIPTDLGQLETEDIILLLILYLMYRESGDSELLIIMGAMFLL